MYPQAVAPALDCARILPGFDFADAYAVQVAPGLNAMVAVDQVFGLGPSWVRALMRMRNPLAALVGLKAAPATGFPVISASATELVLGFDDKHLDFRIVVTVLSQQATVTTVVRCHNLGGRAYLALVKPFHRRIAPSMLSRIGV